MSEIDDYLDIIRREAGIGGAQRARKSTLVATSYNPKTHSIKGILQPQGVETGWIPVGTHGIGDKFGIVMGPHAGTRDKLDGDQFDIEFENGDPNTPIARHRLFSDKEKPPEVQTGEVAAISKFNASIKMNKDGSTTITTTQKQADGETDNDAPDMGLSATAGHYSASATKANNKGGKITHTASDGDKKTHTTTMDPDAGTMTHKSKDDTKTHTIILDIANGITSKSESGSDTHSIVLDLANGITQSTTKAHSRSAQTTITDIASSILHSGNTTVTGTLGVSSVLSAASAAFGTGSFNINGGGTFSATTGGSVTGGLSADTLTVTAKMRLPVYTIAGLAAIASPAIGMIVYVSDTVSNAAAAFGGVPTSGGATTVKRPVTYDGAAWRY